MGRLAGVGRLGARVNHRLAPAARSLSRGRRVRFTDRDGNGSRIGRTITAPLPDDPRPVTFAFVSCQSVNEGKLNGYRRMIFEDERAAAAEQIGFVLHLGDFIYEVVQYPDEVATRCDRTIDDVGRIPDGGRTTNFHYPLTVEGYRVVYRGYLADPDLQDATRALAVRLHLGQSRIFLAGPAEHRPGRRSAAAWTDGQGRGQPAWFEYIPARVKAPSGSLETFGAPAVNDVPIEQWDGSGLGIEPNYLTAINSLIAYRSLRYGRHLDLILTDQHSTAAMQENPHPFHPLIVGWPRSCGRLAARFRQEAPMRTVRVFGLRCSWPGLSPRGRKPLQSSIRASRAPSPPAPIV